MDGINSNNIENNLKTQENRTLPQETIFNDKQLCSEDLLLLQQQWNVFSELRKVTILENPIKRRRQEGNPDLSQGTLIHGTSYDLEKLKKIKESGILSGELIGIPEDNETHYCADFFKVPEDMSVTQYSDWCNQLRTTPSGLKMKKGEGNRLSFGYRSTGISFIIDASDPRLQKLLKYDAYDSDSSERMKNIINHLPNTRNPNDTSSILVGIPSNFISGLIIGEGIKSEEVKEIKQIMGDEPIIYNSKGEVI